MEAIFKKDSLKQKHQLIHLGVQKKICNIGQKEFPYIAGHGTNEIT